MLNTVTTRPASAPSRPILTEQQINANFHAKRPRPIRKSSGTEGQGDYAMLGAVMEDDGWLRVHCSSCVNVAVPARWIVFRVTTGYEREANRTLGRFVPLEELAPESEGGHISSGAALCGHCNNIFGKAEEARRTAGDAAYAAFIRSADYT
jgi:hypothetical protein